MKNENYPCEILVLSEKAYGDSRTLADFGLGKLGFRCCHAFFKLKPATLFAQKKKELLTC